jgi:replicative DNA helicase
LCAAAGHPGLIVSEEMSAIALGKRTLNYVSDLSEDCWHGATCDLRVSVNDHFEHSASIYIAESCGTAEAACKVIDSVCEQHGCKIVVVDYAQLLRGVGNSRYEQVTSVSVAMKQAAVRNNVVLLLLCQLSRDIEKRPERQPKLSDLRDSGQIEQDADVVLFLQWPVRDDPGYRPVDEYRIYVAKNRNRATRRSPVVMKFSPTRQRLRPGGVQEFTPEDFSTNF